MKAWLRHAAWSCRTQIERLEYFFALIGAAVVGTYVMGLLLYVVHRGFPL